MYFDKRLSPLKNPSFKNKLLKGKEILSGLVFSSGFN
jgi:hypothetical protein